MITTILRVSMASLLLATVACTPDSDDDSSSETGADAGTSTGGGGTAAQTGDGTDAGTSTGAGESTDAGMCVPNSDPCGFENLCCDEMYCFAGDCEACKPVGSPCDGNWIGNECCGGECVTQPSGEGICEAAS